MLLPKNPRVLVCAYSCVSESGVEFVGGEAELGWNLAKQLARFSDVTVLTHAHNQLAIERKLADQAGHGISFVYIRLPRWLDFLEHWHKGGIQVYSYLWQIKAYFVARRLHQENAFSVFHHITYANDWMASYIGALLPVPYIRGPGGGAHVIPPAFLTHYSTKELFLEKVRSLGQWLFRLDPFFIMGQARAKRILVCNQEAFNALASAWQKKAELFPVNGISQDDMHKSIKQQDGSFTVVTAGKLIKLKNVDLAIRAFARFRALHPNARFIVVGDGPEHSRLVALAKELNVVDVVVFKKWLPRNEALIEIAAADVFLFASLRDGGGAVVVEAMAQGKPVVCFDAAGPGLHIDKTCGIKIIPTSPEQAVLDMTQALETVYENDDLRQRLGAEGQKRAITQYLWNALGNRLHDIYETVIFNQ